MTVSLSDQSNVAWNATLPIAQRHDLFLDTSTKERLTQWDDLLRLQVDLFAPAEMEFLATFPAWKEAHSVLDVGCGNGAYASRLRRKFAEKTIAGVDLSRGLIEQARRDEPSIEFEVADFLDYAPVRGFDVLLMRFLVQHLGDFGALLDQSERVLNPGGSILIIEPDLANSGNAPATPLFEELLRHFEDSRSESGRERASWARGDALARRPAWELAESRKISVNHSIRHDDGSLCSLFVRWIDMFEGAGVLDAPFIQVRQELASWAAVRGASTRIVLTCSQLRLRFSDSRTATGIDVLTA